MFIIELFWYFLLQLILAKQSTAVFLLHSPSLKEIEKTRVSLHSARMEIYLALLGTVTIPNRAF